jgi:hypothetical protein
MSRVVLDIRGLAATRKMLATVDDKERFNRERRAVRAAGNIFKPALASSARAHHGGAGNVPASFAKVRVKVSSSNRRGRMPTAIIRPTSPLFNIFEPGAAAHTIEPGRKGRNSSRPSRPTGTKAHKTGKRAIAGPVAANPGVWDPVGRKRNQGFFATHAVRHPGMSSRALLPGVFSAEVGRAEEVAANIIFGLAPGSAL